MVVLLFFLTWGIYAYSSQSAMSMKYEGLLIQARHAGPRVLTGFTDGHQDVAREEKQTIISQHFSKYMPVGQMVSAEKAAGKGIYILSPKCCFYDRSDICDQKEVQS